MPGQSEEPVETLSQVCSQLLDGYPDEARSTLRSQYPFVPQLRQVRLSSPDRITRIAHRDNFTDRYTGKRLVFPGTLRLLSTVLSDAFPYHPNWALDRCHIAYYELSPTLDHLTPIALGGTDTDDNLLTTSMLSNARKGHWTLQQMGWALHEPVPGWDGLLSWFVAYAAAHPELCAQDKTLKPWQSAALRVSRR